MVNVYFRTFGCPSNFAESDSMKELLKKADFEITESPDDAFVLIFSICTVKGITAPLKEIRKSREMYKYKKIIVAGCITGDAVPEIKAIDPEASLISTHNIKDIVSVVEETINDNPVDVLAKSESPGEKAFLPRNNCSPIAIIPICEGCTGNCSYCSVKLVKGNLVSYPMEKIVGQCRKFVAGGAREIWVTAQDAASYMLDVQGKTGLPKLVSEIANIPGDFMIRVGMMNINNIIPVIDEMIGALKNEKVFKFIHIPIQSGNNEVLAAMRRKYTSREFKDAVKKLESSIPGISIATDIICGFPGESKEQFQDSVAMVSEINPDVVNISRFRPRPGTEAALMENQIPGEEAKERCRRITSAFEWSACLKNRKWVGWQGNVILEENGKEGTNTIIGRNLSYKPVIIDNRMNNLKIGGTKKVKITACSKYDLKGEII